MWHSHNLICDTPLSISNMQKCWEKIQKQTLWLAMYITALVQSYSSKKILNIKMIQKIKLHVKKKTLKDMKTKELQRNRFQYSTADDKEYEQFSG